ncbi:uncharacterized protein LOC126619753 [Malus sylvestris]|uniref:uncharacterized protein LOC126619753 n=1 Tax=Malus sylvestris TaxID=3752 RepID=UPI0021ABA823|nr:uncharacterized protein LOC126619753 [Malus sylvestris]
MALRSMMHVHPKMTLYAVRQSTTKKLVVIVAVQGPVSMVSDVRVESFEVLDKCKRKVVATINPTMMVERVWVELGRDDEQIWEASKPAIKKTWRLEFNKMKIDGDCRGSASTSFHRSRKKMKKGYSGSCMGLELAEIRAGPSAARLPGPGRAAGRSGDAGDVPANRVRGEARWLGMWLEKAAVGEAFLLQGGDCTESFKEFNANNIRDTFRVFLQMAITLIYGDQMPVIKRYSIINYTGASNGYSDAGAREQSTPHIFLGLVSVFMGLICT